MERVILSGEMKGFSTRTDTSCINQKDNRRNSAVPNRIGVHGQASGPLSTSVASEESLARAPVSASVEDGFNLCDTCSANSGSSLPLHGEDECRTAPPTLRPPIPCVATHEAQAILNADLGGDGVEVSDGRPRGGAVAQPLERPVTGPAFRGWGGETAGTRYKGELAEEDWLEVAHALFDTLPDP